MDDQVRVPRRLAARPIAANGFHTPWFVHVEVDGVPDFRVIGEGKFEEAIRMRRCWICGQRLVGPYMAFNIGPMSAINRLSAEPPSHRSCATYAALTCPFLTHPNAKRRERNLPDGVVYDKEMSAPNPGITCVWTTLDYEVFPVARGDDDACFNYRIRMGEPESMAWYREGRPAEPDEIRTALEHANEQWRLAGTNPESS